MAKNIINEIGGSRSLSIANTTTGGWGAPSDGSRTNILAPSASADIPDNTGGYGIRLDVLNGVPYIAMTSQVVTITNNDGSPLVVHRHRFTSGRDTDYLLFYMDDEYENGCLKMEVLKPCWLLIEGTAVTSSPGGAPTQSSGIGIRRFIGTSWNSFPTFIAGGSYTNEPATGGLALPLHSIHYYAAGTILKIGVRTTHLITLRPVAAGTGTGDMQSYIAVTRISN